MVILEETETGAQSHQTWLQVFIFADLICCVAVILPVVW
jgi:hypothetical protein